MKKELEKIYKLSGSRIARNIIFWAVIFFIVIDHRLLLPGNLGNITLYLLVMVLVYFNNLVLVPQLLVNRKYVAYFTAALAMCFATALLYTFLLASYLHHNPMLIVDETGAIRYGTIAAEVPVSALLTQLKIAFNTSISLTFTFTLAWYMMDYARQQKMHEAAAKKQVETELQFLRGQINPHFLFNTLNNLYGLAIKKSDTTPDAILKLSAILRYLLYESNAPLVSFAREKEIMLAYIELELLRLDNQEGIIISISSDAERDIPPLLWLPLLENVFKHGTRFITDDYAIEFRCNIQNNELTIFSRNKYDKDTADNGTAKTEGIGLANLKQRLELLYPGQYTLAAGNEGGYYIATATIKLN